VALWMAAGANPKEVAARAGHTSLSFTLDRYGHLLPGSEQRLNDAIDALAEGAQAPAEVTRDTHDSSNAGKKAISFAHVTRTPNDDDEMVSDTQASDLDVNSGRCGTRTHDLSRVNPFRCAALLDGGRRKTA